MVRPACLSLLHWAGRSWDAARPVSVLRQRSSRAATWGPCAAGSSTESQICVRWGSGHACISRAACGIRPHLLSRVPHSTQRTSRRACLLSRGPPAGAPLVLGCALMLVALGLALTLDRGTADHKHSRGGDDKADILEALLPAGLPPGFSRVQQGSGAPALGAVRLLASASAGGRQLGLLPVPACLGPSAGCGKVARKSCSHAEGRTAGPAAAAQGPQSSMSVRQLSLQGLLPLFQGGACG